MTRTRKSKSLKTEEGSSAGAEQVDEGAAAQSAGVASPGGEAAASPKRKVPRGKRGAEEASSSSAAAAGGGSGAGAGEEEEEVDAAAALGFGGGSGGLAETEVKMATTMAVAAAGYAPSEAAAGQGLVKQVIYRADLPVDATTLGGFKESVAARYSVPPSSVTFRAADGKMLPDSTRLEDATFEMLANITEATGNITPWVFALERGASAAGGAAGGAAEAAEAAAYPQPSPSPSPEVVSEQPAPAPSSPAAAAKSAPPSAASAAAAAAGSFIAADVLKEPHGPPLGVKSVIYRAQVAPEGPDLAAFKLGVAARYSVPASSVVFHSAENMVPLPDGTRLDELTGDFIARISEAGGHVGSWVVRLERA